ncbi:MAG: DUF1929 domain-containing protein [Verrucomicrobia bacterium]|nr:DUF1929 domain-containing protein [Verrucomicrobiota bacterium]
MLLLLLLAGNFFGSPRLTFAQPDVVGQWGTVQGWPFVSVHTHLLPTGKVLFWDYSGNSRLWDPATTAITSPTQPGRNLFCAGHSFGADGKLFVPGGHIQNNVGLASASFYDPVANTWTSVPDMNAGRWYPSSTTLANGDVLVTSGDANMAVNDLPQVYQVSNNTWRNLTSARLGLPLYPRTFLAPNGKVFFATSTSRYLDTAGAGAWTTVGNTRVGGRDNYGSAAMYEPGKVLWVGGGDPPLASCEIIDLNAPSPAWAFTGSMAQPRRQNNATILPDGKVLATGGSSGAGFNNDTAPVRSAELWNPVGGTWTTLSSEQNYRGYHSCATLLPDGRVLSSGGDNQPNAQVFSPPYLFKGTRPTISSAPTAVSYGETFFVGTPDGASITKVTWTRIGSLTHAQNWDQRFLNLSFSQAGGGLNVTAPANVNHCPPGHYLLWILNGNGVPSVAPFVRISDFSSPPAAPTGLTASPGIREVTLNWNASPTATSYNVKRSTTSGGPYTTIATGVTGTTHRDTGLTAGTTYFYVVSGVNPQGESPNSNQASATPVAGGTGTGLPGDYYDNIDFTAFKFTRTDATVNFDWGTGSPDPSMAADTFSIRWTGQVEALFTETVTFRTVTDDGVRLWVNGQLIIDKWIDQAPTEWTGNIALTAGQRYDIRMDFYENGGGAVAQLLWSSPNLTRQIIPQSQLYPPSAGTPPAAPTNLSASATGKRKINLSWTQSSSPGITQNKVYRATVSGGPYSLRATLSATTSYLDTGLTSGTTYYYVVTAVNTGGESAFSNQASATAR